MVTPEGVTRRRAEAELRRAIPEYDEEMKRRDAAALPEVRVFRALRTALRWVTRRIRPRSSRS